MFGTKIITKGEYDILLKAFNQNKDLRGLKDCCVLRTESYPCDKCKLWNMNCKKLLFADQTICICLKEEKKDFVNALKPMKK